MLKLFTKFSTYTLAVAILISIISAYYSIVGLTSIFAAAVVPIIIMGGALELGKLTAAVWLKINWSRAQFTYKLYLVPAVAFLMMLTSMGIFGFLSKAHSDQSLVSGDVTAKIAIYDEKIKTAKENIDANRKALKQLDESVDQVMGRSTDEKGADKAVAIRRSQQKERGRLLTEIEAEQKKISSLNEERAPIAAEVRKVEAEVGPIKYIAALIYGDNPDANLLESAVRWVIILIVAVFDPLALVLILAAQQSMRWERDDEEDVQQKIEDSFDKNKSVASDIDEEIRLAKEANDKIAEIEPEPSEVNIPEEPEVKIQEEPMRCYKCDTEMLNAPGIGPFCPNKDCDVADGWLQESVNEQEIETSKPEPVKENFAQGKYSHTIYTFQPLKLPELPKYPPDDGALTDEQLEQVEATVVEPTVVQQVTEDSNQIATDGVTEEVVKFHPSEGYVVYDGKSMSIDALRGSRPDLVMNHTDPVNQILFGAKFPEYSRTGDIYVRVDTVPHLVYKFNNTKWIKLNKEINSSYLQNISYIQYLISKIDSGEYDPELLTDSEQDEIASYLEKIKP